MATSEEVNAFLQYFKAKLGVWGVVFRDDRGKNLQTLLELEITPAYGEEVLRELQVSDYSGGQSVRPYIKGLICGYLAFKLTDVRYCQNHFRS